MDFALPHSAIRLPGLGDQLALTSGRGCNIRNQPGNQRPGRAYLESPLKMGSPKTNGVMTPLLKGHGDSR